MKGRGTPNNPSNRFHSQRVEVDEHCEPPRARDRIATTLKPVPVRTIISTNQSPDVHFDQSINPYQGCEHGCIYCFARPTHAYLDLSPGLDFETRIFYKPDAAARLREELSRPQYECREIAMGTNTDPYQPAERKLGITRSLIETASEFRQPISIVTKSSLVTRDIDLLAPMSQRGLCKVVVSVTTLDDALKRLLEPRTPSGAARLGTISNLRDAGIRVGVLNAPIIPKINDHELESLVEACAKAGSESAGYVLLRLPLEVAPLFRQWLETHFPERAGAVMSLIRQNRRGSVYQSSFGERMRGVGPFADLLEQRFTAALRRHGLPNRRFAALDTSQFRVPGQPQQMSLAL